MPRFKLKEIHYRKPEGIDASYAVLDQARSSEASVLVVSFRGEYPDGSRGHQHGAYIAYTVMCGLHAFSPDALVLDFRELNYRWGNSLLRVFQDVSQFQDADLPADGYGFPIVVVASAKSSGLQSLLRGPASGEQTLFDDIDDAIATAQTRGQHWLDT